MPAYYSARLAEFITADSRYVAGILHAAYAADGYATQFTAQTRSWEDVLPRFQTELRRLVDLCPGSASWTVILEFPLYRLRKRLDALVLADTSIAVIEIKSGAGTFAAADERQVEEYALDLRDFHSGSKGVPILPILWATGATTPEAPYPIQRGLVAEVQRVGETGLSNLLAGLGSRSAARLVAEGWSDSAYRPVPTVIQAATTIFAGHDVRSIAQADASNLRDAASRLVELIVEARDAGKRALVFLTGVPGSGKTLAGLQIVHDAVATGAEREGDIVYLSGNTPLVIVLREALARDTKARGAVNGRTLDQVRRDVRARIQHINDFLKEYLLAGINALPHEHAIVFDEAQRAWDEAQGVKKFSRTASEPALLLELMGRHRSWCACICLVGGGVGGGHRLRIIGGQNCTLAPIPPGAEILTR